MFLKKIFLSFVYAFSGILNSIKTERNFRVHIVAAIVTFFFGAECKFTAVEYILLSIVIFSVMSAELINTALEALADSITTEENPLIKKCKDAAAGAVLIRAVGAVVAAYFLYVKDGRIIEALVNMQNNPVKAGIAIAVAVLCVIFVAGGKEDKKDVI